MLSQAQSDTGQKVPATRNRKLMGRSIKVDGVSTELPLSSGKWLEEQKSERTSEERPRLERIFKSLSNFFSGEFSREITSWDTGWLTEKAFGAPIRSIKRGLFVGGLPTRSC